MSILAKEEINALAEAMRNGGLLEQPAATASGTATAYDLTSNHRVVRGRLPALEVVNDRQAGLHRQSLTTVARRSVDVSYSETITSSFSDVIDSLPKLSCVCVVEVSPLAGLAAIAIDPALLFCILDMRFGGGGTNPGKGEDAELTQVELSLARRIVDSLLTDMEHAWRPIARLRGNFVRAESNPRFVTIAAPGDAMVEIVFDVEIGDLASGSIRVVIPFSAMQPLRSRLSTALASDGTSERADWTIPMQSHILDVPVETVGVLGTTQMQLSQLMNLNIGDVLKLDTDANSTIPLKVGGVVVTHGTPQTQGGNVALQIAEPACGPGWRKSTALVPAKE